MKLPNGARQSSARSLLAQAFAFLLLGASTASIGSLLLFQYAHAWQWRVLICLLCSALVAGTLGYVFARRLSSGLLAFTQAAEQLGSDLRAPPLVVSGPAELVAAACAFNGMQERLRRHFGDQTALVGAIAHDLRAPLARLAFRLEFASEDVREKAAVDISEMDAMIAATLAFVRGAGPAASRQKLELRSLLESVKDNMVDMGFNVTVAAGPSVIVEGDLTALRRLFSNLAMNAVKYGQRARMDVRAEFKTVVVTVDDDGMGLPSEELERVFLPFYRREGDQARASDGFGLGLAIARAIARAHGGDVKLKNRPEGGLRAEITLPCQGNGA